MTPTQWLRAVWDAQPVNELPPPPVGYQVDRAVSTGWLRHDPDGWRVTDDVARLFNWK